MAETPSGEAIRLLREDLREHQQQDREDFADMSRKIGEINAKLSEFDGAQHLAGWMMNVGIPAIFLLLAAYVGKHW